MTGFLDDRIDDPAAGAAPPAPPAPAPSSRGLIRAAAITLVLAILAAGVTYVVSNQLPSRYESTSKVLLVPASQNGEPGPTFGTEAERIATTQRDIITSFSILEPVAQSMGIPKVRDLQKKVAVEIPGNSDVLSLTVSDGDPVRAQRLVAAIVGSYQDFLAGRGQATQVGFRLLDAGLVPEDPASPRPLLNAAIAAVLILLLGIGLSALVLRTRRHL